jgi:hypothetical protein
MLIALKPGAMVLMRLSITGSSNIHIHLHHGLIRRGPQERNRRCDARAAVLMNQHWIELEGQLARKIPVQFGSDNQPG